MVAITLNNGESISIAFANADGEFQIHYDSAKYPQQLVVEETGGFAGNIKGGALEIMHHENFGKPPADADDVADEELVGAQHHGFFVDARGNVRHTDLVRCLVREKGGDDIVVVTLDMDDTETGEFTFYPTMDALIEVWDRNDLKHYPEVI